MVENVFAYLKGSFIESLENLALGLFRKKLNIGIVCHPFMGGSGISATALATELAKKGHNVHLIVYKRPYKVNKKLIKVHIIPVKHQAVFEYFPITLTTATKIEEVIKKEKLDLVNVHYALPYSVSSFLAKQMLLSEGIKIPIITTLHGTDIHTIGKKKDFRSIIKFSLDNSDGIVAVSKFLEKQAREIGVNSDIKVIYNYVDTEKFKREISKETKKLKAEFVSKNEKLILHVSNFREIKRVEDIIRAFNKIKRKVPSRLVLVGSGPRIGVIRELISRLKLKKRVFLVGKQKKPEKYYSIADLFMLASEREACPLSILEAMSSGVPVVASNVGGVPEIVVEGKTGYLVDKGDVVDMAKKSIKILCDRRKLKEMREFSRKEVLEKYSKTKIIKEYEDYFLKNI